MSWTPTVYDTLRGGVKLLLSICFTTFLHFALLAYSLSFAHTHTLFFSFSVLSNTAHFFFPSLHFFVPFGSRFSQIVTFTITSEIFFVFFLIELFGKALIAGIFRFASTGNFPQAVFSLDLLGGASTVVTPWESREEVGMPLKRMSRTVVVSCSRQDTPNTTEAAPRRPVQFYE